MINFDHTANTWLTLIIHDTDLRTFGESCLMAHNIIYHFNTFATCNDPFCPTTGSVMSMAFSLL